MASTYSTELRVELMAAGENRNTWGTIANNVFRFLEDGIAGTAAVSMSDADYSLTTNNGSADEARNMMISISGAHTAVRTLTIPAVSKVYIISNATSGGYAITVSNGTNTVSIPNGGWKIVWTNGTAVTASSDMSDDFATITGTETLTNKTLTAPAITGTSAYGSGAVLSFNAGDVTVTHSANTLTMAGGNLDVQGAITTDRVEVDNTTAPAVGIYRPAASTLGFSVGSTGEVQLTSTALSPMTSDGNALGTSTLMWSDAFFASGAVINFNNGNMTITHSAGTLAFSAGTYTIGGSNIVKASDAGSVFQAYDAQLAQIAALSDPGADAILFWDDSASEYKHLTLGLGVAISGTEITSPIKAWVRFNGTGTPAIAGSYNVSSITDNGTGDYTINFTTAMADANYAAVATSKLVNDTTLSFRQYQPEVCGFATGSVRVLTSRPTDGDNTTAEAQDHAIINVVVYG